MLMTLDEFADSLHGKWITKLKTVYKFDITNSEWCVLHIMPHNKTAKEYEFQIFEEDGLFLLLITRDQKSRTVRALVKGRPPLPIQLQIGNEIVRLEKIL